MKEMKFSINVDGWNAINYIYKEAKKKKVTVFVIPIFQAVS